MPYATINGLTLLVELESMQHSFEPFGEHPRPFDNKPRIHRKGVSEVISFESCLLEQEDADSHEALFENNGEHWSFETDAWSDRGLGPEAGSAYSLTAGGYQGATNRLTVTTGIIFNPRLRSSANTVSYARTADGGSTWEFITVRSDGAKWIDGVRNDATVTTELVVSGGGFLLDSSYEYGELSCLGQKLSEAHAVEMFAFVDAGGQFTRKNMLLDGDCVNEPTVVVPMTDGQGVVQKGGVASVSGWLNNVRNMTFKMRREELI